MPSSQPFFTSSERAFRFPETAISSGLPGREDRLRRWSEQIAGYIGGRGLRNRNWNALKRVPSASGDDVFDDRLGKPDHKLFEPTVFNLETVECLLHSYLPVDLAGDVRPSRRG
jgi:hypothetical protein